MRFWGPLLQPLGSHVLQNWRLESYILVLFDLFCYLPGFIVSCCAFDASKTQTALVYAISVPFFEASGEPCSSKLAPGILYPNTVWLVLLAPWFYGVVLRARCLENSNSPSISDFGAPFLKPLGSHVLQNWRLESYILVLFDFFCYLPGFIVSCCAFDASKTKTDLVYAIRCPFLKPLGSHVLQNWRLKS